VLYLPAIPLAALGQVIWAVSWLVLSIAALATVRRALPEAGALPAIRIRAAPADGDAGAPGMSTSKDRGQRYSDTSGASSWNVFS
jgi:hypothetical protein